MLRQTLPEAQHAAGQTITLVVVEAETLVREGLVALFSGLPDMACKLSTGDCVEAVREAEFLRPDAALLDTRSAFDRKNFGLRLWRERLPGTALIVFDHAVCDVHLRDVLRGTNVGYATRNDSFEELSEIVRRTVRGSAAYSTSAWRRLRETPHGPMLDDSGDRPGLHRLTPRELEILVYLAQGLSGKQCSEQLGISSSTVDNHRARIMKKLQVRKTVELTRIALREGLMPR